MAISECLNQIVGVRGLCTPSTSTIFINDMPDSGIARMESMADSERDSFAEIWDKVYERAIVNFQSDIRKSLSQKIQTNPILRSTYSGRPDYQALPDSEISIADSKLYGQVLKVWGSPLMNVAINSVTMAFTEVCSGTIYIIDLQQGQILYSQAFTSTGAGISVIPLTTPFEAFCFDGQRSLFVGFSVTPTKSFLRIIQTGANSGCCISACKIGGNATVQAGSLPNTTSILLSDITSISDLPGIFFNFGIRCSLIPFICDNQDVLKVALRYKAYIELLAEVRYNDSLLNRYTTVPGAELDARITTFEGMYQNELSGVLSSITFQYDNECWDCVEPVSQIYLHP